ncbi:MAG: hypothetical protein V1824_00005, partial [archaeon]
KSNMFKDRNYNYNENIIFSELNIKKDQTNLDTEFKTCRELLYKHSADLVLYIFCKNKKIKLIITDNWKDFVICQAVYNSKINIHKQEVIFCLIDEFLELINEIR